jgi:hypothetical protein
MVQSYDDGSVGATHCGAMNAEKRSVYRCSPKRREISDGFVGASRLRLHEPTTDFFNHRPLGVISRRQLFRPARKNLLQYRTPTMPIADMRHVVAAIDDRAASSRRQVYSN